MGGKGFPAADFDGQETLEAVVDLPLLGKAGMEDLVVFVAGVEWHVQQTIANNQKCDDDIDRKGDGCPQCSNSCIRYPHLGLGEHDRYHVL